MGTIHAPTQPSFEGTARLEATLALKSGGYRLRRRRVKKTDRNQACLEIAFSCRNQGCFGWDMCPRSRHNEIGKLCTNHRGIYQR